LTKVEGRVVDVLLTRVEGKVDGPIVSAVCACSVLRGGSVPWWDKSVFEAPSSACRAAYTSSARAARCGGKVISPVALTVGIVPKIVLNTSAVFASVSII
jgi:hypothetical protein